MKSAIKPDPKSMESHTFQNSSFSLSIHFSAGDVVMVIIFLTVANGGTHTREY
jgi:hypothetical protein